MKPFFIEILSFWYWADKLGREILGHLAYFRLNYQHSFCCSEFRDDVFHYSTIISTKIKPLYPTPKYLFGPQRI